MTHKTYIPNNVREANGAENGIASRTVRSGSITTAMCKASPRQAHSGCMIRVAKRRCLNTTSDSNHNVSTIRDWPLRRQEAK